jgi:type I restriction enzyme S subunit
VPIGSIILTTRAPIGNVLIATKELCTNQGCKSLIPFRINSEFLYYYVSVSSIQLNVLGQGTTFLELSTGNLSTFKVPLPPKKEQEEIAKHLQIRTTAIDKLVNNIDVQIEKLQELRKIKIYEAVTGKIKVNAYVEATA